jgi:DNA-binding beta-propeller fold protein YncE
MSEREHMKNVFRRYLAFGIAATAVVCAISARTSTEGAQFKILGKFALGGGGRWDYLVVDPESRRLYMSHSTDVTVLDADSGAPIGRIPDTPGVHGIALAPDLGVGFTSNGGENRVTVFDLKTLNVITKIDAGVNPDSILYHPATHSVFVMNRNKPGNTYGTATVIDAVSRKAIATFPLGGKPEFSAYDDQGNVFVNLDSKSSILVIDAAEHRIKDTWKLDPCEKPSGLAINRHDHILFSVCDNKLMAVVNADNGKVVQILPIGDDCDAVAFDPGTGHVFASNGEGTVTVVRKDDSGKYRVVQTVTTFPGSKTVALDLKSHKIFLPSAKFTGDPTRSPRPPVVPGSLAVLVIGQ